MEWIESSTGIDNAELNQATKIHGYLHLVSVWHHAMNEKQTNKQTKLFYPFYSVYKLCKLANQ